MTVDTFLTVDGVEVPAVTAAEMREVDRVAIEEFDLPLLSMMENAGRSLARQVRAGGEGPVTVMAGNGGNGGGGLACARHLANRGVEVTVVLDREPIEFDGAAATQLSVLQTMGVPTRVGVVDPVTEGTVVDALVGYGLAGELQGRARSLVGVANDSPVPVVSLDVPTGLDATSGEVPGDAVAPDRVLTLALPKTGLADLDCQLSLADVAIPAGVYDRLGIAYEDPFAGGYVTELARR